MLGKGVLYVVATPIGNLGDISQRALDTLRQVDVIAAEDTRHSRRLFGQYDIRTRCFSLHEHNERGRVSEIITLLNEGKSVALVSDAGTPLISDPGFVLLREVRGAGLTAIAVPGPCAFVAALSIAGLPSDRFLFEGFLPSKSGARRSRLQRIANETATLIFYESCHRILACIADMIEILAEDRRAVVARELTKLHETTVSDTLEGIYSLISNDPMQQKGEFVLLVSGATEEDQQENDVEVDRILIALLKELPIKSACRVAIELTGLSKNDLYKRALSLGHP